MAQLSNKNEPSNRKKPIERSRFWNITFKDCLGLFIGGTIPVVIAVYTGISNSEMQKSSRFAAEEQQRLANERREFDLKQTADSYQQQLYKNFLDDMYTLYKDGQLNDSAKPWAFANARYRAGHRIWDPARKSQALQFLKEKELIGRQKCEIECNTEYVDDIIRLNGLNFDNINLTSDTEGINQLDLSCVKFDQVSMKNAIFTHVNLNGITLGSSRIDGAQFSQSSFKCATFNGTKVHGTNFGDSDLDGASFINVNLSTTNISSEQMKQAKFENVTMPYEVTYTPTIMMTSMTTASTTDYGTKTTLTSTISSQSMEMTSQMVSTESKLMSSSEPMTTDVSLIYGVQLNFDPTSLPSSWTQCYNDTYDMIMSSTILSTILDICNKTKLMLGCRPIGRTLLNVAAMGFRADVLYNCSTSINCTKVANGVGWYFSDNHSWGFASENDPVNRTECDIELNNSSSRLCWHTFERSGGYRCGANIWLNHNKTFERVIYHSN